MYCSWNIFDYKPWLKVSEENRKYPKRNLDNYWGITQSQLNKYLRK